MQHRVKTEKDGWLKCELCHSTFKTAPSGNCPGVPFYSWEPWPEGMYTAKQINERGLKPGARRGAIRYTKSREGWFYLFRLDEATRKPPLSDKQRAAVEKMQAAAKARRTCKRCGTIEPTPRLITHGLCDGCREDEYRRQARQQEIAWARGLLKQQFVIVDVETTGLDTRAEIVQIAVIDQAGTVLLDSLIKPEEPINERLHEAEPDEWGNHPSTAYAVNGISNAMVADAPGFKELYPQIQKCLEGRLVIAYNMRFEQAIIRANCKRHGLEPIHPSGWMCAMEAYAAFCGEMHWRSNSWQWQSLESAVDAEKLDIASDHSACQDARATLALITRMAQAEEGPPKEDEIIRDEEKKIKE